MFSDNKMPPKKYHLIFYSDAAGSTFRMYRNKRINYNKIGDKGVVCLSIQNNTHVWWWSKIVWPLKLLNDLQDHKGRYYGSKTDTLEAIGILLPLLCLPKHLKGKSILFKTDNISVVERWYSKIISHKDSTSKILNAVDAIANFLNLYIDIEYVPRTSNKWSVLADNLSRVSTTSIQDIYLIETAQFNLYKGDYYVKI